MSITEVKHHLDGREERFDCELLLKRDDSALVRFVFHQDAPHKDGPFRLPAGEIVTLAAFWERRSYLIYRLLDAGGQLIGHRFDVCEDVRIGDEIHYTDLLLDVWMPPDGTIHVLDQDEVENARISGRMTERQNAVVKRAESDLSERWPDAIRALDELLAAAHVAERADQPEDQPHDG